MEAVPRLPMISFELKTSTEKVTFGSRIKQYIATFYHEDPEAYNEQIHNMDALRGIATRPAIDISGCQLLKKYYCQLHFLKSRFPMEEGQPCAITFSWKDNHSNMICSVSDIDYEISCILYNIGALHSQLGAADSRTNPEGMKMACTHFQCAVWAFQTLRDTYSRMVACLLPPEMMNFMKEICLAQAQECILEKSMLDNRKATIIAKVAVQVVDYYKKSLNILSNNIEDGSFADILGSKPYKKWCQYISFKISYNKCISLLYQGQQAEEQQKMGERVAFYQNACECLEEARKLSSSLSNKEQIDEALAFTLDVVEGKRKAAKNENEFIYHEDVIDKSALQEVKGASLVKGIPFNVNDVEVSGPDIFAKLVPMEAHEAASLYSEQKAQMLRRIGEIIEKKDQALAEFLSSLQLDYLSQIQNASGLIQEIVDRAAAMSARPNAVGDLVASMTKLSDMYNDVEGLLKEIQELLKEEEDNEKNYQSLVGKRAPSIIATDLSREFQKYMEAHNKASESNQNLHKAINAHISNLKLLSMPLHELQQQIPAIDIPNPNIDMDLMDQLEKLVKKIEEMKGQRASLWNDLRTAIHNDDITGVLVTKEANQSLEDLFQRELDKHKQLYELIEQNTIAQENILKAMVNVYAEFSDSRKYIQDVLNKRKMTITALISSYDTYDDLLSKAQKGLEFYTKLETNVTKLLQRVKGAVNVQQEERDQILKKNKIDTGTITATTTTSRTPKLKDYLDSRKMKDAAADLSHAQGNYSRMSTDVWPPSVRPAPLGSEITTQESYNNPSSYNPDNNVTDSLSKRMATLMTKDKSAYADSAAAQQYNVNQNYNTYTYPTTNANTYSTNSYHTITSASNSGNYAYGGQYTTNVPASASHRTQQPQQGYNQSSVEYYQQPYPSVDQMQSYPTQNAYNSTQPNAYGNVNYAINKPTKPEASSYQNYYYGNTDQSYNVSNMSGAIVDNSYPTPQATPYSVQNAVQHQTGAYQNDPKNGMYGNNPSPYQNYYYTDTNTLTYMQTPSSVAAYADTQVSYTQSYGNPQISHVSENEQQSSVNANQQTTYGNATNAYATSQAGQPAPEQVYYGQTSVNDSQVPYINPNVPATNLPYGNEIYGHNQYYGNKDAQAQIPYAATSCTTIATSTVAQTTPSTAHNYTYASAYGNEQQAAGYGNIQTQYGTGYASYPSTSHQGYYQDPAYNYATAYQNVNNAAFNYLPPSGSTATVASMQQEQVSAPVTATPSIAEMPQKSSNIDLLSGLDFTISQMPLTPQTPSTTSLTVEAKEKAPSQVQATASKSNSSVKVDERSNEAAENIKYARPKKDPFLNADVLKQFANEIDKVEKFVNGLTSKTANGQTTLELKWKFIVNAQDGDSKRAISVARCYPLKNRYPDILPYDYSRVELKTTKDDYINATHIKDVANSTPPFIITQNPLACTVDDFWSMVWEQQTENIVCIMNDNELGDEIYWPTVVGKNLTFPNKMVSLKNVAVKEYWTERTFSIDMLETRESRTVGHYQFTAWPTSILPVSPGPFVQFTQHVWRTVEHRKCLGAPLIVHCSSGIGRSGLFCLLMILIDEVARYEGNLPDLSNIIVKMSIIRKNVLRDPEHFKFAYEAFLFYLKDVYKRYEKPVMKEHEVKIVEEIPNVVDPLSTLDPLWATKRNQ